MTTDKHKHSETLENYEHLEIFVELYMDLDFESLHGKPSQYDYDELQEFLEFLGFVPGGLYCCTQKCPWVFDPLEEFNCLSGSSVVYSESCETFCYVDTVLFEAGFQHKTQYMFAIRVLLGDKVVYFPLPIQKMTDDIKYKLKNIFREAQTEES